MDEQRGGPLVLTGSQRFLLSEKIIQTLAGRAAILELLPFSMAELCRRKALTPETFLEPAHPIAEPEDLDLYETRKAEDVRIHPLRGAIFENFAVNEIRKLFLHNGQRPPLYFWRDSRGLEIDLVLDMGTRLAPVEIKSAETVAADFFDGLDQYIRLSHDPGGVLIYGGSEEYGRRGHYVRPCWKCS